MIHPSYSRVKRLNLLMQFMDDGRAVHDVCDVAQPCTTTVVQSGAATDRHSRREYSITVLMITIVPSFTRSSMERSSTGLPTVSNTSDMMRNSNPMRIP